MSIDKSIKNSIKGGDLLEKTPKSKLSVMITEVEENSKQSKAVSSQFDSFDMRTFKRSRLLLLDKMEA